MRRLCPAVLLTTVVWTGAFTCMKAPATPEEFRRALINQSHTSLSRQFVIHDAPVENSYAASANWGTNMFQIDPSLFVVSCERIKKSLDAQLHAADTWTGKITIWLHHARAPDENIVVEPLPQNGFWIYSVQMPDVMDRRKLLGCMTELVLLERAGRGSDHTVEIPAWLSRGLAREAELATPEELLLEQPHTFEGGVSLKRTNRVGRNNEPAFDVRQNFRNSTPLDFEHLSWPGAYPASGSESDVFVNSSQFFVHELLALPDGRNAMKNFLSELPHYMNWQLAFFKAFAADFAGRRELDKWWDLAILEYTSRDATQRWSSQISYARLGEALVQDVEVRHGSGELPSPSHVTLQSVINDWDTSRQVRILQEKSRQLLAFELTCSRDVIPLVEAYRNVIEGYLAKKGNLAYVEFGRPHVRTQTGDFSRETVGELDKLDAARIRAWQGVGVAHTTTFKGSVTGTKPLE